MENGNNKEETRNESKETSEKMEIDQNVETKSTHQKVLSARTIRKIELTQANSKAAMTISKKLPTNTDIAESSSASEESHNIRKKRQRRLFVEANVPTSSSVAPPTKSIVHHTLERFFLKQALPMRWVVYEWFYSNLDRGFFNQNDFQDCLNQLGLAKITKLTRSEWSYVRSIMGKPRRFSPAFLVDEKEKLNQHRDNIRIRNSKNSDIPSRDSLLPGERVFVFHNHSLHKAVVVALIQDRTYKVTLDGGGEALIADTDIAPEDLHTTSPIRGRKRKFPISPSKTPLKKRILAESASSPFRTNQTSNNNNNINTNTGHNEPPSNSTRTYVPAKGDLKNAALLLRLLEKKEKLLQELAEMNNQAEKMNEVYSQQFQHQYAWLVVALENVNKTLEPALVYLQSRRQQQMVNITRHPSFDSWYEDMAAKSKQISNTILSESKKSLESQNVDIQSLSPQITELISLCINVLIQLQTCSEKTLSKFQLSLVLEAAMNLCWPKSEANTSLVRDLSSEMQTVKQALINQLKQSL